MQALLHAARKGPGQIVNALRIDFHLTQPVETGPAQLLIIAHTLGHQAFADVGASGHAHAQTVTRALLDKPPFGAQQGAALGFAGAVQVQPLVLFVAVTDAAALRRQAAAEQ
ncbi:hypothetical protein D3C81_1680090 [compost metagenome]